MRAAGQREGGVEAVGGREEAAEVVHVNPHGGDALGGVGRGVELHQPGGGSAIQGRGDVDSVHGNRFAFLEDRAGGVPSLRYQVVNARSHG